MHTLRNDRGMIVRVIGRGARIVEVHAPDRRGRFADVTLGLATVADYHADRLFFGAVVGRSANRLAAGRCTIDGRDIQLPQNDGEHHLHGGPAGFDTHDWDMDTVDDPRGPSVRFTRTSPAGEQGYPGTLTASVAYTLSQANELIVDMHAQTDAPTLCNLVQHAYWNLAGHNAGSVDDHELTLHADAFTPVGPDRIPTGDTVPVDSTPLDFRTPTPIGPNADALANDPRGFDHNMVIRGDPTALRPFARIRDPHSGRVLDVLADQPGAQLYSAGFLSGDLPGKDGATYPPGSGLCIESQRFPDAANTPDWLSPVLRPGEHYRHTIVFRFSTDRDHT